MKRITLMVLAAGVAAVASAHERPRPRGCSVIEVAAPGLKKQPRDLRFVAGRIIDLTFEARLERPVYGDHVLHFKVMTPGGFLYQDIVAPFNWPKPGRKGRGKHDDDAEVRPVSSAARGLPVQQLGEPAAHGRGRRDTVEARLPVAGTSITMSTLYGRWSVQAFLDDQVRPCSPVRRFKIESK